MPADPRAADVARALLADPADGRTLDEWGRVVNASRSTLARHFLRGTRLTFTQWRTQVRVQTALDHLAAGEPVDSVAPAGRLQRHQLVHLDVRRTTGLTPAAYRANAQP